MTVVLCEELLNYFLMETMLTNTVAIYFCKVRHDERITVPCRSGDHFQIKIIK